MDYLTRRHSDYMELVRNGVSCGKLVQCRAGVNLWDLEVIYDRGVHKETAKRLVRLYVESQWGGFDISYYINKNLPHGHFMCRFHSQAL